MVDSASNQLGWVVWWTVFDFRGCLVGVFCKELWSTMFHVVQGGLGRTGRIVGAQGCVRMG